MKMMTCKQLGGACDLEFKADSFEQIAAQSKQHGKEMFMSGDQAHIDAMQQMQELMQSPADMNNWMEEKRKEFESLPEL